MKVLCNAVKDSFGTVTYYTPIASAAQIDSVDVCIRGETLPHHHIDWRFAKLELHRSVLGWVGDLEDWQKHSTTLAKEGKGYGPKQVLLPNYGNDAISYEGEYAELERVRSDEEVADVVQFRTPFSYLTTYLGHTKAKSVVPYQPKWLTWRRIRVVLSVLTSRALLSRVYVKPTVRFSIGISSL